MAEQAMTVLVAAYVGQPAAVVSTPAADVSPQDPLTVDAHLLGRGCKHHPLKIRGWCWPLPHHGCLSSARLLGRGHGRLLCSCSGGAAFCFTPSVTAHPPGTDGLFIGFSGASVASLAASSTVPRLSSQRRCHCLCAHGQAPSINAWGNCATSVRQALPSSLPPHADATNGWHPPL